MIEKEYIEANDLTRDAFALAAKIYKSGFHPDVLLVLWRGGTPVGIVIHEYLLYRGLPTYHAAVKAESYTGIGQRIAPRIEHLEPVLEKVGEGANVLVVDDIFDTGRTLERVRERLQSRTPNVKIATLFYKPENNQTDLEPHYYMHETDRWIVFPHELMDLAPEEILAKDPYIAGLLT